MLEECLHPWQPALPGERGEPTGESRSAGDIKTAFNVKRRNEDPPFVSSPLSAAGCKTRRAAGHRTDQQRKLLAAHSHTSAPRSYFRKPPW